MVKVKYMVMVYDEGQGLWLRLRFMVKVRLYCEG